MEMGYFNAHFKEARWQKTMPENNKIGSVMEQSYFYPPLSDVIGSRLVAMWQRVAAAHTLNDQFSGNLVSFSFLISSSSCVCFYIF